MKYNLSEIMKAAWKRFKSKDNWGKFYETFAACLKFAWKQAKAATAKAAEIASNGIVRMHYSEYKTNHSNCQTVEGSYDKATKTIEVMTKVAKGAHHTISSVVNGICPHCRTYCYGDCTASKRW